MTFIEATNRAEERGNTHAHTHKAQSEGGRERERESLREIQNEEKGKRKKERKKHRTNMKKKMMDETSKSAHHQLEDVCQSGCMHSTHQGFPDKALEQTRLKSLSQRMWILDLDRITLRSTWFHERSHEIREVHGY